MRGTLRALLGAVIVMGAGPALAQGAPAAGATTDRPALAVLEAARAIELDMSGAEVAEALRAAAFETEMETDLPPDGLNRLVVAVPQDDDCLPRGRPFTCPAIRVVLLNDPQRGYRAVRIEAFQNLGQGTSVAEMFERVAASLGPPLQTEMVPEQVRGGMVVVWRQRWRQGLGEGPTTEVFVTQEAPERPGFGLADPREPATGVGFVLADTEAEGAFAAVRRQLRAR